MNHLREGCLDNINIHGYYIYGSGQVLCVLKNGPPKIVRISKDKFSVNKRLPFEIFPSASVLKSPTKTLQKIIALKILRGKVLYRDGSSSGSGITSKSSIVKDPIILRNPIFKRFHKRILEQLSQIMKDKSSFKQASNTSETREEIKKYLAYIIRKRDWDPDDLQSLLDEVIRELAVETVINE